MSRLTAKIGPAGVGPVEVDGQDISGQLRSAAVQWAPGQPTRLVLELLGDAELDVDGTVEVVDRSDVVAFLASVDPKELDKAVIDRAREYGEGDAVVMTCVLDILKERADAACPQSHPRP